MQRKYIVTLTKEERSELEGIISKGKHKSQKYQNALVLLNCDEGPYQKEKNTNEVISSVLNISMRKIDRVKKRFVEEGIDVTLNGKESERVYEKKIDGDLEAHIIALSCSDPPEGHSQWSLRLLADKAVELEYIDSISYESIRRVLKKNELKPWKKIGWVIPPEQNSSFVAQMEMVLDVYKRSFSALYPVVCMDESPKQLISETRSKIPASFGKPAKYDYEYRREGVCNIFMACEPLTGKRMVEVTERKTKRDWAQFIEKISKKYDSAKLITLIMDNYNTHTPGSFYEAFHPEKAKRLLDRFELIFTPKHGSWLNMAEIELNVLNKQCLNRRIGDKQVLINEIRAWETYRNGLNTKINWQFTTADARVKLKRLYPTIEV
ncbi:IS630 family transposase [uncultured Methanolobus sp.]|uniref:IS630 family transposase n=1 Tax=uncultured Methanolobus sp. TaxID=218300 RepID=UPI0029C8C47B|nr:IS630 family transposase [uncultured Methanolobus sp.]